MLNRSPRIQNPIPSQKVVIPPPQSVPTKPASMDWISIGIPLAATVLSVVLMLSLSGNSASYLYFLPIMFASYLAAGINWAVQTKKYKKDLQDAKDNFQKQLELFDDDLKKRADDEYGLRIQNDPDVPDCLQKARTTDHHLGERRPDHQNPDFLQVRVGTALQDSHISVTGLPKESRPNELGKQYKFADDLVEKYGQIKDLPFLMNFLHIRHLGIAGAAQDVNNAARAIAVHLCTHHWPAEVQMMVVTRSGQEDGWRWVETLPHAAQMPICKSAVFGIKTSKDENLKLLEQEIQTRITSLENQSFTRDESDFTPLPALFIFLDQVANYYEYSAFALALKQQKSIHVYLVFLVDRVSDIPGACGAFLDLKGVHAAYNEAGLNGNSQDDIRIDRATDELTEEFAGYLNKIKWLTPQQVTEPPKKFSLRTLFEKEKIKEIPIAQWWEFGSKYGYLRAPIGKITPTNDFVLNLDEKDDAHGPHGVIGGTTGSGKSELLKTLVLSYALTHHPYDLNFILIDFKGGAAFNDLKGLPHVVGVITDIETHENYAERVILALNSEVQTRKEILKRAYERYGLDRLHIDEYKKLMVKQPLPRLIIIFDEFAEFKNRYKDESQNLISIACQGRSLGIHLILCTQNPQSVVEESISTNARFRICLKMSTSNDGNALIGAPDAWRLPRGRAYFRVNDLMKFQAAFTGDPMPSLAGDSDQEDAIYLVHPDQTREMIYPQKSTKSLKNQIPTEAVAIVEQVNKVMDELGLRRPPPVWFDPLGTNVSLPDLILKEIRPAWNGKTWIDYEPNPVAPLGVCDDPANRKQPINFYNPQSGSGSLLVFGSPGSGKTTLLKTIAFGMAHMGTPADIQIHCLDFTGQAPMTSLKKIPHVGTVVTRGRWEIADRLLNLLKQTIIDRGNLFRKPNINVNDIVEYNLKVNPQERLPIIFLFIDSFGELKRAYQEQDRADIKNQIIELAQGGRSAGIHLVISANLTDDLPDEMFSVIVERITFRQAQKMQLSSILGTVPERVLQMEMGKVPPAGRGLVSGVPVLEFQAALPAKGKTEMERSQSFDLITGKMNEWLGARPPVIEELPIHVSWQAVQEYPSRQFPMDAENSLIVDLGIRYDNLYRDGLDFSHHSTAFFVTSTIPGCGKTSVLRNWILSVAMNYRPAQVRFSFIDFHTRSMSGLRNLPHVLNYVDFEDQMQATLQDLERELEERKSLVAEEYKKDPNGFNPKKYLQKIGKPLIVIVIDDYDSFRKEDNDPAEKNYVNRLEKMMLDGEKTGYRFVLADCYSSLTSSDALTQMVFKQTCGIHLGGVDGIDYIISTPLSIPFKMKHLPEGRGYLIRKGQGHLMQSVVYWSSEERQSVEQSQERDAEVDQVVTRIKDKWRP
jgi:S-DNA-T family DNA segregation ATPase FtsK/SpoIIIE